jgi:hypothetical protein
MAREPNLPPCPTCRLDGGSYVREEIVELTRWPFADGPGFEVRCCCCGTRSFQEMTKPLVLELWKKGIVKTPIKQARDEKVGG